mgnify:CR=1 FL=1
MKLSNLSRQCFAEVVGTFCLVFAGTGAIITNDVSGGAVTHVGVALTFGLVVMAMIYAVGEISGAHLNPAVTFGFMVAGRTKRKEAVCYSISQFLGALLASLILRSVFPMHPTLGSTLPSYGIIPSFIFEIFLTFILMFVIINLATGSKEQGIMAGLAIGATVGLDALFGGPISGASMNPARSLGPAVVSGNFGGLWVYLLAPLIGSIIAIGCWKLLVSDQDK